MFLPSCKTIRVKDMIDSTFFQSLPTKSHFQLWKLWWSLTSHSGCPDYEMLLWLLH